MATRTYAKEDAERGLAEYNAVCRQYGLPEQTLTGMGFVAKRDPGNDVVIGVEEVVHVPDLFIKIVLETVDSDGNTKRRVKRIDFNRPLIVIFVVNGDLLVYRQFRHGVSGPRINTPRGWSESPDQSHEGRVKHFIEERLGPDVLSVLGSYDLVRLEDFDEDDAMSETPTDVYAVIANGV